MQLEVPSPLLRVHLWLATKVRRPPRRSHNPRLESVIHQGPPSPTHFRFSVNVRPATGAIRDTLYVHFWIRVGCGQWLPLCVISDEPKVRFFYVSLAVGETGNQIVNVAIELSPYLRG